MRMSRSVVVRLQLLDDGDGGTGEGHHRRCASDWWRRSIREGQRGGEGGEGRGGERGLGSAGTTAASTTSARGRCSLLPLRPVLRCVPTSPRLRRLLCGLQEPRTSQLSRRTAGSSSTTQQGVGRRLVGVEGRSAAVGRRGSGAHWSGHSMDGTRSSGRRLGRREGLEGRGGSGGQCGLME